MKRLYKKNNLYLGLIHYPVLNKKGDIISSAITNLDLHDIARVSKTYGIKSFYIVTPIEDHAAMVIEMIEYWFKSTGYKYNPKRSEAFNLVNVKKNYIDVLEEISEIESFKPKTIATTARSGYRFEKYSLLKKRIISFEPYVLFFGTAWGLSDNFLNSSDYILSSIKGFGNYNHLSVRSAVSITLDRLLGYYS